MLFLWEYSDRYEYTRLQVHILLIGSSESGDFPYYFPTFSKGSRCDWVGPGWFKSYDLFSPFYIFTLMLLTILSRQFHLVGKQYSSIFVLVTCLGKIATLIKWSLQIK